MYRRNRIGHSRRIQIGQSQSSPNAGQIALFVQSARFLTCHPGLCKRSIVIARLLLLVSSQGVLLSVPEAMEDLVAMKRLWVHEVLRVYYDRLVDDADRSWIISALHSVCKDKLDQNVNEMFARLSLEGSKGVSYCINYTVPQNFFFTKTSCAGLQVH